MLKKILIGVAAVIALFVGYVALQPSSFRVYREVAIHAPAEVIFPHINTLKKMQVWNPWSKVDPTAKETFEGPAEGIGSVYSWDGNSDIGAGHMTIIESQSNSSVKMRLDFVKPFAGTSTADFTIKPGLGSTSVTWAMSGESPFFQRFICVFMNMDKMVGGEFEKGLNSLKAITETEAKEKASSETDTKK